MRRSKNFDKVKRYYNMGMWNEMRVRNAVKMNWITEEEFKEITDDLHLILRLVRQRLHKEYLMTMPLLI